MIFKKQPLILAYHSISKNRTDALSVSASEFDRQLKWLKNKNYKIVSIEDAVKIKNQKSAVITFDDGYRDNYEIAFPILKKYGFNATIFLATDFVGTEKIYHWDKGKIGLNGNREDFKILNWEQILEMKRYGITFGSHSCSHKILTEISINQSTKEIVSSKQLLEEKLDMKINIFCYPEGKLNDEIINLVQKAGYHFGVVTPSIKGIPKTNFTIRRVGVYQKNTISQFRLKVKPAFQSLMEKIRPSHYI